MDPNKALTDLRENVQEALRLGYSASLKADSCAILNSLMVDIAEGFDNLDVWLGKGGFLPQEWRTAKRSHDIDLLGKP